MSGSDREYLKTLFLNAVLVSCLEEMRFLKILHDEPVDADSVIDCFEETLRAVILSKPVVKKATKGLGRITNGG
jgi:hypothetical protein